MAGLAPPPSNALCHPMSRSFLLFSLALTIAAPACGDDGAISPSELEFFEARIRPVLVTECYECHSGESDDLMGGLRLDTRDLTRHGGDSGPSVVPNDLDASLIVSAIRYEDFEMPPKGKLPDATIRDFERWITMGAPDPRDAAAETQSELVADISQRIEESRGAWAFSVPQEQRLPDVQQKDWPRERIDYFVLHRLEQQELAPTQQANRQAWLRRITFDLIGLPPSPHDVDAFLKDDSNAAHETVVQRLLASPHFGERWARMWLDVARYAEDQAHIVGNNKSLFYPNAYLYRDWVIDAFNNDMPYDRFVSLQLAADVIEPESDQHRASLGFLGLGPKYYDRGRLAVKAEEWEDRVDTVTRGLLGLTVACARCHDHKYDPIGTADYYALAGVFASTNMANHPLGDDSNGEDDPQKKKGEKKKKKNDPEHSMHVVREGNAQDLNVFIRGNVDRKGPVAPRRFLPVLCSTAPTPFSEGSGRKELAAEIASPTNPLTARVIVNRVFGQLTGTPIVGTPSNFGALGEPPSHPELLDDLASRFVQNGWSIKWLVREIVLSSTYRQSSHANTAQLATDPDNQWFGRMNRRRLSVEAWRDSMLAATGQLEPSVGGQSFEVDDLQQRRRTLYGFVSRFQLNPMLQVFDFPDANVHSASRSQTITPLQKLFVMNNEFVVEQAKRFADRVTAEESNGDARIQLAYRLLFARAPNEDETQFGLEFVEDGDSWVEYAHALIATNEMMYVD